MRTKLGQLFTTVLPLIENAAALPNLKRFLRWSYPELKHQIHEAELFDDVMDIVREKCSLINVACLKAIIDHCNIKEAIDHITAYQSEVDKFCEKIKLQLCENENIMTYRSSLLKCETIEFVLEWKTDEHTLKEIKDLLSKAFGSIAKQVLVKEAKEGNSVIVTCYAPRYMMDVLRKVAEKNLAVLKQMGVIKLTIGYNVIWDEITMLQSALKEKEGNLH